MLQTTSAPAPTVPAARRARFIVESLHSNDLVAQDWAVKDCGPSTRARCLHRTQRSVGDLPGGGVRFPGHLMSGAAGLSAEKPRENLGVDQKTPLISTICIARSTWHTRCYSRAHPRDRGRRQPCDTSPCTALPRGLPVRGLSARVHTRLCPCTDKRRKANGPASPGRAAAWPSRRARARPPASRFSSLQPEPQRRPRK